MTVGEVLAAAESLPLRPVREALADRPFVVIAPHPDDESLGCGGLIADACRQGVSAKVVIVSDGAGSHPNSKAYPPERLRTLREEEATTGGRRTGLEARGDVFLRLPDRFVPHEGEEAERAIDVIADCVKEIGAGSLFVSWRHDPHCDHEASYRIAREVQRRVGESNCSNMSCGDIRSRPRLRLIRSAVGSGSTRSRGDGEEAPRHRCAPFADDALIDDDPGGFSQPDRPRPFRSSVRILP